MKNSLHRKKLQLAMQALASDGVDRMLELDHNFVAREFFVLLLCCRFAKSLPKSNGPLSNLDLETAEAF